MKTKSFIKRIGKIFLLLIILFLAVLTWIFFDVTSVEKYNAENSVINDVTQLNPIHVAEIRTPHTTEEIMQWIKNHKGPISVGGGRFSMGGQTATDKALQLDMRQFNKVISFSKEQKEITVQSGLTWRKLQEYLDAHNLSVKIMQTYANFTVGGSLSVNVHGRYIGLGPLIYSVKSIKIVLPNGDLIPASPSENQEIFYGAIGGYGAFGVITEATLSLSDNVKVERKSEVMPVENYKNYFFKNIRDDSNIVFHNADIYPEDYSKLRAVSYVKTNKEVTVEDRLQPLDKNYRLERFTMWLVSEMPFGKSLRKNVIDPLHYTGETVEWRNYEASYDVSELEPASRKNYTYVLQEYFVPVNKINEFVPQMAEIFNRHEVNVINVSIRHAKKDPGSLLAWAKEEVFAFVVYYKQKTAEHEKNEVAVWTRELIDASVSLGGAYYLPYQIHATSDQFRKAYPNADVFFRLKKKIDPTNKFRNRLWDAYYQPEQFDTLVAVPAKAKDSSRFISIMSDKRKSDGIYRFLQNVYGLYPTDEFHYLIQQQTKKYKTDKEIYEGIQKEIPEVTPFLWSLRYAKPALEIQKEEIASQTVKLLDKKTNINGYLEFGTTGRYVNSLEEYIKLEGPVYLMNDDHPDYSLQEITERGQLSKIGTFYDINHYEPISAGQIPDTSLDLVTIYIGLHHAPVEKLDAFVKSVHRIIRPDGKLVIRDHDVSDAEFGEFVSCIHDVFYSGLGKTWDYTSNEIRNFTSSDQLTSYLEARGFKGNKQRLLQPNDPSKNTMMIFTREERKDLSELNNIKGYLRDEGQTYLTLPEWYLVYSPDEYARFIKSERPSKFPYFGASHQFWSYYSDVHDLTKEKYAFNQGYHLMVFVIGTSYTVENYVKGAYEKTFGRISEWFRGDDQTQEDIFAAKVAQEYVDFIRVDPWYEFPFASRLISLWEGLWSDPFYVILPDQSWFISNPPSGIIPQNI